MIRISQLKLPLDHTETMLEEKICQKLKIKKRGFDFLGNSPSFCGRSKKAGVVFCVYCGCENLQRQKNRKPSSES
ncbi:MAG: hypothetical protein ACLTOR_10370 [Ruminococcus sp.]